MGKASNFVTLLFVLLCIKVSNVLKTLVSDSPTVEVFWSRHPCSWSASDVAAVLTDFRDVETSLVLQISEYTTSFWPKQLRMI